jgi:hypothetical protein
MDITMLFAFIAGGIVCLLGIVQAALGYFFFSRHPRINGLFVGALLGSVIGFIVTLATANVSNGTVTFLLIPWIAPLAGFVVGAVGGFFLANPLKKIWGPVNGFVAGLFIFGFAIIVAFLAQEKMPIVDLSWAAFLLKIKWVFFLPLVVILALDTCFMTVDYRRIFLIILTSMLGATLIILALVYLLTTYFFDITMELLLTQLGIWAGITALGIVLQLFLTGKEKKAHG